MSTAPPFNSVNRNPNQFSQLTRREQPLRSVFYRCPPLFHFSLDFYAWESYLLCMEETSTNSRTLEAEPAKTIRRLVDAAILCSGMSRDQIADELTKQVGEPVTSMMLFGWTSESKKRLRFPAGFVSAFCEITGDDQLQRFVIGPRLRRLLSLAEAEVEKLLWERRKRKKRSACRK